MPTTRSPSRQIYTSIRNIFTRLAMPFMVLWLSAYANASVIQGTFTGIAYNSRINAQAPWASNFDGQTVTGTFFFDPYNQNLGPWPPIVRPGSLELTFYAAGQSAVFDTLGDNWGLVDYSTTDPEYIRMSPGELYPYYHASLLLFGPLFDNNSLESLRAAPIDLANSFASFFAGRSFGADIRLTSVTFDATSIPEPPEITLVASALFIVAILSRRKQYLRP